MREKQISCLITSDKSKNMPFLFANSFLAIFMLISQKQAKEEELVKNAVFLLLAGHRQRVNKVTDLF